MISLHLLRRKRLGHFQHDEDEIIHLRICEQHTECSNYGVSAVHR